MTTVTTCSSQDHLDRSGHADRDRDRGGITQYSYNDAGDLLTTVDPLARR